MYQALYRKYRPRCFCDVSGQNHITGTLRRQISLDRLSHAYLFVGTRGTGKTTCAKILARAVNCENPTDGEPCNKCASCEGIENGSILDVLELDAASNNGVDNVRALREEAIYSPASVRKRVYIIDEVHMLSTAAFNALLKILEEPPEHLLFILATTELHKVPATILSRCQRFSFKRLSLNSIAARLNHIAEQEGLTLTADAAEKLSALSDGSMRDALSLLDQCASDKTIDLPRVLDTIGLTGQQEIISLADAAADGDTAAALIILDRLYDDGRDMPSLLNELAALTRDILVYNLSPDSPLLSGSFDRAELSGLSAKLKPERLFSLLEVIRETIFALSRGGSVKLSVEMCIIRMCDERLSDDFPALLSRITRLEDEGLGIRGQGLGDEGVAAAPQGLGVRDQGLGDESDGSVQLEDQNNSQLDNAGGFWESILELLKNDPPVYAVLSNKTQIQAELRGGTLVVRAGDQLKVNQIESKMFSEPLKEAAGKIFGREVIIRAEIGGVSNDESKREKLDRLSAFDIIKFE